MRARPGAVRNAPLGIFRDGVIVYYTFLGRDGAGGGVRVPIAIRFDSTVGTRE